MASSKTSRTIEIISFLIAIASFAEASIIIRSNHTGSDKMQMLGIVTPTPARCYWSKTYTIFLAFNRVSNNLIKITACS